MKVNKQSTGKQVQQPIRNQQPVRSKRKKKKDQFDRIVNLLRSGAPEWFVD